MSDHEGYGFPPGGGIAAYLFIRALWGVVSDSKPPAPAPSVAKRVIVTPPPAGAAAIAPRVARPVVPWTGDGELLAWRAWRLAILVDEDVSRSPSPERRGGQGVRTPERKGGQGVRTPDRRGGQEVTSGPRLLSLAAPYIWDGPGIRADRLPTPEEPGGIYALRMSLADATGWQLNEHCWVTGWVALSGRVVEHDLGYRAERAVIRELRLGVATHLAARRLDVLGNLIGRLEERYQAPVDAGLAERQIADRILASGFKARVPELPLMFLQDPWQLA